MEAGLVRVTESGGDLVRVIENGGMFDESE